MGRNSSGTRGGLQPGDATYKGSVGKPEPLVNMKDPALYKATKEAISRYHSVLGVRQKNVKLAELSAGTYGVHVTANGKSEGVKYKFDSGRFSNIYTGAAFDYIGIDVMSKFDSCNSIDIDIHLFDIAGNERIYTKQVDIFDLQAELFRYLSIKDGNTGDYTKGENWRTGESGVIKITAGTHIERIEVIYPDEWIDKQTDDVTFPLNREKNIYTYVVPEIKTQVNYTNKF